MRLTSECSCPARFLLLLLILDASPLCNQADARGEEEEGGRGGTARDQIAYGGRTLLHGQG